MAITYTQLAFGDANFTPAADGVWGEHDAQTILASIPVSAVLEILMENNQAGHQNEIGVRAVGSGLARIFDVHEAEAGGNTHMTLLVQTDSDGKFWAYSEDVSDTTHHIVGYFEGLTYIETFDAWDTVGVANGWNDKDLFTDYSVPKERVCEVVCENRVVDSATAVGVRIDGSALGRWHNIAEAEGDGGCGYSDFVKTDADGEIEYYYDSVNDNAGDAHYTLVGYFDAAVDFTEHRDFVNPLNDAIWTNIKTWFFGVPANAVAAMMCFNSETASENELGTREDGTALDRKWDEHEDETVGVIPRTGFRLCVVVGSDADRTIEVYEEDTSECATYFHGWFSEVVAGLSIPVAMHHYNRFKKVIGG